VPTYKVEILIDMAEDMSITKVDTAVNPVTVSMPLGGVYWCLKQPVERMEWRVLLEEPPCPK
jgi:hypothetical protein